MFYTIRRILFFSLLAIVLAVSCYLYQNREWFKPGLELLGLIVDSDWEHEQKTLGQIQGEVVAVSDGTGFLLRDPSKATYYFSLTGLEVPRSKPRDAATKRLLGEGRTNLSNLILSKQVTIDITYTNLTRAGLGVVYLNRTNINAKVVEAGMAKVNRKFLKSLPVSEQYGLLCAERKAQESRTGLWGRDRRVALE